MLRARADDARLTSSCLINKGRTKRYLETSESRIQNRKKLKLSESNVQDLLPPTESVNLSHDEATVSMPCDGFAGFAQPIDCQISDNIALTNLVHCYCCRTLYRQLHFFYSRLCPQCASLNFSKRTQVVIHNLFA